MRIISKLLFPLYFTYSWVLILFFMTTHFVVATLVFPFLGKKGPVFHRWLAQQFSFILLFFHNVKFDVYGLENLPQNDSVILASNHQSMADIIAVVCASPRHVNFLAKKELKYVPFVGWSMIMAGDFLVDRSNPREAINSMTKIESWLRDEIGMVTIFPEGTRSETGELGDFKRGSFKLALDTGVSVVPVYIHNTIEILPKKSLVVRSGKMSVSFGAPMEVQKLVGASKTEEKEAAINLTAKVRQAIVELRNERLRG